VLRGFCLFSLSNFTFSFHGFNLKELKISTGARKKIAMIEGSFEHLNKTPKTDTPNGQQKPGKVSMFSLLYSTFYFIARFHPLLFQITDNAL